MSPTPCCCCIRTDKASPWWLSMCQFEFWYLWKKAMRVHCKRLYAKALGRIPSPPMDRWSTNDFKRYRCPKGSTMIHPARQSTKLPCEVASQDDSTMELRTMAPTPPTFSPLGPTAGTHLGPGLPRFPWNKGISLTKPPFGVRSCEVAIIWPDIYNLSINLPVDLRLRKQYWTYYSFLHFFPNEQVYNP